MLRNLAPTAESLLLRIYNKCWLEGMSPERWHRALLLTFLKPNKPPQLPSSYRPIALTSCMCKVLERIVNMRLTYFLETNNLLNPLQYGIRKMRETEDVLVRMEGVILDSFAQQKHLFGIFIDIEKA